MPPTQQQLVKTQRRIDAGFVGIQKLHGLDDSLTEIEQHLRSNKTNPFAADLVRWFHSLIRECQIYMCRPPDQPESLTLESTRHIRQALEVFWQNNNEQQEALSLPTAPVYVLCASPSAGKTTAAVDFLDHLKLSQEQCGIMVSGKSNGDTDYHQLMGAYFGCSDTKNWVQALLGALKCSKTNPGTTAATTENQESDDRRPSCPSILILDEVDDNNVTDLTIHFLSKLIQTPLRRDGGF